MSLTFAVFTLLFNFHLMASIFELAIHMIIMKHYSPVLDESPDET